MRKVEAKSSRMEHLKVKASAVILAIGAFATSACGLGPDNDLSTCPAGWRTDLVVDGGVAVGILGAIGDKAIADFASVSDAVHNEFTDIGFWGSRNNADQVDEVACETESGEVVLDPHGARLTRLAAIEGIDLGALQLVGDQLAGEAPDLE